MARKTKDELLKYKLKNTLTNVAKRCEVSRDEVRTFVEPILNSISSKEGNGVSCRYCAEKLTLKTVSFDHVIPLSRGGSKWGDNLAICCYICNKVKGALTDIEYSALLTLMASWEEVARLNVSRRLRLGGMFFGRFKGKKFGGKRRWLKKSA